MLKRGLVLGAAAIAGILGIAVVASASEKKKPVVGPAPEPTDAGFKGPNKEQCQAWYNQRVQLINTVSSLDQQIAEYEAQGWGTPEDLLAARLKAQSQANHLAILMQDCE